MDLKKYDQPDKYHTAKAHDQLEIIKKAQEKYDEDNDVETYIRFWENIWNNGGLTFESSRWHFVLADLYIKTKRYNAAFHFLNYLNETKPQYAEKVDDYKLKMLPSVLKDS